MDSVIRGDDFHTRKNRPLPRMRFGHDSFSKKPGWEEGKTIRGSQLALFGLRLRGFQSGCTVVVTKDEKQPGRV